jgi:hypothetical protein
MLLGGLIPNHFHLLLRTGFSLPAFWNPPSVGDAQLDSDIKSRSICTSLSP